MTTFMTQITPPPASLSVPRPSLAQALDPGKALRLAPTLQPDVDLLTSQGLITFGVKGSGKSNLLALLVEQLSRFFLPQLILDTEREYHSLAPLLPHGVLATAQRCPSGADILHHGLQVIVDLQSWSSDEAAARAMCHLIDDLFTEASSQAAPDRVPCIIHLDEAAYWLPQEAVIFLTKETRKALADAFHKLTSRGRKQGLTPFLYTQSISEIAKSVIRQAGIKVLMRQTLDIDLTRYCQFIQGATSRTKKAIQAYPSGKAIVILPDGSQHRVQFYERQSEHVSHTPQAQAALVKFAGMALDVSALPMRDMTVSAAVQAEQSRSPARSNGLSKGTAKTMKEQVQELLASNPALRVVDLVKLVGCGKTTASNARLAYFERYPELMRVQKTTTEHIYDLLETNPTLHPVDLSRVAGCSQRLASRAHQTYFEQHPEQTPQRKTATQQIYDLLAENTALRAFELRKLVDCDQALASKVRRVYFERYPEKRVPVKQEKRAEPVAQRVYDLLAENPTLRPAELMKASGCSKTTAARARRAYFDRRPEKQIFVGQHSQASDGIVRGL